MMRAAAVAALLVLCLAARALAAESGQVVVSVRSAVTNGPLRAVVRVSGPVSLADVTDTDGSVVFGSLPDGDYELRASKDGYVAETAHVVVEHGAAVRVAVHLAATAGKLRVIGSVSVRTPNTFGSDLVSSGDTLRTLISDPASALGALPGVVFSQPVSPGQATTISLEGHDPSATAVTLDGVPLNVPGRPFDFAGLDFDLVSRTSIAYGPAGGASAGTVSLRTIEPTLYWQSRADGELGTFGRSLLSFQQSGRSGAFGFAMKHSFRANTSPLDGETFADASGLDYRHAGAQTQSGDAVTLTYRLGNHALSARSIASVRSADALCAVATNAVPCGYGPGNATKSTFRLFSVSDLFQTGLATWTVAAFAHESTRALDFRHAVFDGVPFAATATGRAETRGFSVGASVPAGSRHTVSVGATSASISDRDDAVVSGAPLASNAGTLHYTTVSLADAVRVSPRLSLGAGADAAAVTGVPAALTGHATATWRPDDRQSLGLAVTFGSTINTIGQLGVLSPPATLQYECPAHTAIGALPRGSATTNAATGARLTWQLALPRGDLDVSAFGQKLDHATIGALVNAEALPASAFPAGYLGDVAAIARLATVCGAATPFSPADVYLATSARADVLYQGVRLRARLPLGSRLVLNGSLQAAKAVAWSSDPLLGDPLSVFRSGQQLAGVAPLSGLAVFDYRPLTERGIEALAGVRYAGFGNASYLPPHLVVDAVVQRRVASGVLSLAVANVTNAEAGKFARLSAASPVLRANGAPFPVVAVPETPRTVTIGYSAAVGRGAVAGNRTDSSLQAKVAEADSLAPGYLLEKWPLTRPTTPFQRNTGSGCAPKLARTADEIVGPLEAAVTALDRRRAGTPAAAAWRAPSGPVTARLDERGTSYVLTLTTSKTSAVRALMGCQLVHVGSAMNARAAGLPYPERFSVTSLTVYYAPETGFYVIQLPAPAGIAQRFRTYAPPAAPPADPFATSGPETCLPELGATAERLLGQLRGYLTQPQPRSGNTADWTIRRHDANGRAWYAFESDDMAAVVSMVTCAHVVTLDKAEAARRGLAGEPQPAFNYAPELGIYVVK